jgi:hypothetical protein
LPASIAAFASASVSGAAAAIEASAVATAPARTAELTVDLIVMSLLLLIAAPFDGRAHANSSRTGHVLQPAVTRFRDRQLPKKYCKPL